MARPRLLTLSERLKLTPSLGPRKQVTTNIPSNVSASWAWYDKAGGVVQWTFENADTLGHSVVLLRNGYSR